MKAFPIVLAMLCCSFANIHRAEAQSVPIFEVESVGGFVMIHGGPFAAGVRAFLPSGELSVVSVSPSEIKATLPPNLSAGTHLLLIYQPQTGRIGSFIYAQSADGAAPVVLDKDGQGVGTLLDISLVIRKINGLSVMLAFGVDGFVESAPDNITLIFKTSDCTGPTYLQVDLPVRHGQLFEGTVYFAGEPAVKRALGSYRRLNSIECTVGNPSNEYWIAPMVTTAAPVLTPPFLVP